MSKKIMKRSLALGALMAFVITGSAFADGDHSLNHVFDHEQHSYFSGVGSETIKVFFEDGLQKNIELDRDPISYGVHCGHECVSWEYNAADPNAPDTYLFDLNGNTLKINAGIHVGANDKFEIIGTTGSALYLNGNLGIAGSVNIDTLDIRNGVLWNTNSDITVTTKALTIENSGYGINVQGASDAGDGGITIKSDYLSITSGDRAFRAANGGNLNITTDEIYVTGKKESKATHSNSIVLSANKGTINSDFIAGENGSQGVVDMVLGSGVTLTSKIVTDDASQSQSNITLNGATWDVQGDSNVTSLAGKNGNVVINDTEHKIEIGNNANSGLKLKASKALSEDIVTGNKKLEDIAANFDIQGGTKEVTLATQETDIAGESSITYNTETNKTTSAVVKQVSAKNDAISNAGMALKGHYRAHMNDMNKRMGELRMANGEAGVWTRMVRGESEYQDAKMQYNQYQLGYDEKLSVDKRWTVGAAVTFAEGDSSYGYGSTEDKSTAFAIYGSKLNNDGTFVDLIARYARLESDIDDTQSGKGDYSTNGMSVSAEFGKRIQQGKGLWIEPQVELTYGTVDSADLRLDGTKKDIHVDSMDSFIARVGFSMGKDIKQGNVYARASYLYDFDGETETSFSANGVQGDVVKEDFGGGWWEVGVGANINLSKATYIYADIEKTFGGEIDTNWQWNLGVRYSF